MSLAEQIIWLAGSSVKSCRKIGRSRVFECNNKPMLHHKRVKQFIGDEEPKQNLILTSQGVMVSVRLGSDVIFWKVKDSLDLRSAS